MHYVNIGILFSHTEAYNLNFALLYLVSRALGLGHSKDRKAVMSRELQRFDLNADYDLDRDDIIGLQVGIINGGLIIVQELHN